MQISSFLVAVTFGITFGRHKCQQQKRSKNFDYIIKLFASIWKSITKKEVISGLDFSQNSILNAQIHDRRCSHRTSIFSPKKNFRRPTVQPIFAFPEEMKAFLRRTKITNGDVFCNDPSESHFRHCKCRKKRKITFLRRKCRNGPSGPPGEIFEESASHHSLRWIRCRSHGRTGQNGHQSTKNKRKVKRLRLLSRKSHDLSVHNL